MPLSDDENGRTGEAGTASMVGMVGVASDRLAGLPTPPPAIRPPEAPSPARAPAPVPTEEPVQPPVHSEPAAQPEADLPSISPAGELPTMAPLEETIEQPPAAIAPAQDYFGEPVDAAEAPVLLEPVQPAEIQQPAAELPLVAPPEPEHELPTAAPRPATPDSGFRLVVRLQDGERVEIGDFKDFGTAMEAAQEVIEQFTTAADGTWPFYAGRFIRPDLIVSVDVVDAEQQP